MHRIALIAGVWLLVQGTTAIAGPQCEREEDRVVELSGAIDVGQGRESVRRGLLDQASELAVASVLGTRVSSSASHAVADVNGELDERFAARRQSWTRGLARATLEGEEVVVENGQQVLRVVVKTTVCVPSAAVVNARPIKVGAALSSRGEPHAGFLGILEDRLARSPALELTDDAGFAELLVNGRIERVDVRVVPLAQGGASGLGLVGAPTEVLRVAVRILLEAEDRSTGAWLTAVVDDDRNMPAHLDPQAAAERVMRDKIAAVADELVTKIVAADPYASPAAKRAATPRAAPTW